MAAYQRFYYQPSNPGENVPAAVDPPAQAQPANSQSPFVQQPRKELKSLASLRRLVRVELILALAMILFESIADGVVATSRYGGGVLLCSLGTGIWVGVLGAVTAGLGLGAFRSPYGDKCMMVANFVMSIICAVADGIMIIFAAACLAISGQFSREASAEQLATDRALLATESLLLLAAIAHFISSIVSTAFICRNWCQDDSQPAVDYFRGTDQAAAGNGGVETTSDPRHIAVPSGAQVIFVPVGNISQAEFPPGTMPQQQLPQPNFCNMLAFGGGKRA